MLPCVGQGVIALQTRKNDEKILNLIFRVNDHNTFNCVLAEREMLKTIEGDCDTAVGGLATINNNLITLKSELFSIDGKKKFSAQTSGSLDEAKKIGKFRLVACSAGLEYMGVDADAVAKQVDEVMGLPAILAMATGAETTLFI